MNGRIMIARCRFFPWVRRTGQMLLLAGVAAPGIGMSQAVFEPEQPEEEEFEEIRRYTVEMIVFEYAGNAILGNEAFLPDEQPDVLPGDLPQLQPGQLPENIRIMPVLPPPFGDPGTSANMPLAVDNTTMTRQASPGFLPGAEGAEEQVLQELPSHILTTQLEVLDPELYGMPDIYEKLVEIDAYKPIMRAAWTQATYEKDETLPIRLRRLGAAPLRLDGMVTLYLSRYLHLVLDLTIESDANSPRRIPDQPQRSYSDARTRNEIVYGRDMAPARYHISEDRIFRNGEVRYYDHPRFGVLARITRVEYEDLETDDMFLLPGEVPIEDADLSDNR